MFDPSMEEKVCSSCDKSFYPQETMIHKVFCGKDEVCSLPEGGYKDDDCEDYFFCSKECAEKFEEEAPTCAYVPRWKRLMVNIDKVGSSIGVKGIRPHQMPKECK